MLQCASALFIADLSIETTVRERREIMFSSLINQLFEITFCRELFSADQICLRKIQQLEKSYYQNKLKSTLQFSFCEQVFHSKYLKAF